MLPIKARELMFTSLGHLHEYHESHPKNKTVYKLKLSLARYLYGYMKEMVDDVNRCGNILNNRGMSGETNTLSLGLVSLGEGLYIAGDTIDKKLTDKWHDDLMKLYKEIDGSNEARFAHKLINWYPTGEPT